jgi:hypothetical protein
MTLLLSSIDSKLAVAVCLPVAGRMVYDTIGAGAATTARFTSARVTASGSTWAEAVEANGQGTAMTLALAACRLVFLHLLQPLAWSAAFIWHWAELSTSQAFFGSVVGLREALYFFLTVVCVLVHPAFLLVDVGASLRRQDRAADGFGMRVGLFAMYVLAPEKFVALCLLSAGGLNSERGLTVVLISLCVLDLGGVSMFLGTSLSIPVA